MKISVIVPCRNENRHIREFLESVFAQQVDADCDVEILVADGMSDDGTREALREYAARRPAVRMIDNPGRIVSTGLNSAIQAASGEWIIRMDVHTTYAPDYIRECVRAAVESGADNVGGPWVATGRGMIGRAIAAAFRVPFCNGGGKAHDPEYAGRSIPSTSVAGRAPSLKRPACSTRTWSATRMTSSIFGCGDPAEKSGSRLVSNLPIRRGRRCGLCSDNTCSTDSGR